MRRVFGACLALVMVFVVGGAADAGGLRGGRLVVASAASAALGEDIDYTVYLPAGYGHGDRRYPVLYLLHGRGDTMEAWTRVKPELDRLIADRRVPPLVVVMPDAPWSERGSYYVDSAYVSGRPVETALTRDLVSHVDATYRTIADRDGRLVGGYSMGGYGALRYALAHQELFAAGVVLSPAVYTPLPPGDSSAREFGAFGVGDVPFVDDVYARLNYPALLPRLGLPLRLYIAVGDDEWANPEPEDFRHDIDFESAALYNAVRRVPGVRAELRVTDGGHDWDVWVPAFVDGVSLLL